VPSNRPLLVVTLLLSASLGCAHAVAGPLLRGDITRDGRVDVSDPVALLGFLFLGDPPPECEPLADANDDGRLDVSDPVYILSFLFLGGPRIPELDPDEAAKCDPHPNQAPVLPPQHVVRSYPGFPLEIPIGAVDPDGDALRYAASNLPAGAVFDDLAGVFRWTPAAEQLGPFYIPFAVCDNGSPALVTRGVLVFRIAVLGPCARPRCDPGLGCDDDVAPLGEACCQAEPEVRLAEPAAGCPGGRVLHVGRDLNGFGRLENCDWLRVAPLGQGGHIVRLNVEARCINADQPVAVRLRLETPTHLLFDRESARVPHLREDGFAERLGFAMGVAEQVPIAEIEGAEALLTCILTDAGGVQIERRLRVVLTRGPLPDLPEPEPPAAPGPDLGCPP
jgi:hypothetical protein